MKPRSSLKRRKPLGRTSNPPGPPWTTVRGLAPSKPPPKRPVGVPLPARSGRLKKRGARSARVADELAAFREAVLLRAGFCCERCGISPVYHPWIWLEAHHRLARSQGGSNDPSNGAALCGGPEGCHARVTDHRARDWRAWVVQTKPGRAGEST